MALSIISRNHFGQLIKLYLLVFSFFNKFGLFNFSTSKRNCVPLYMLQFIQYYNIYTYHLHIKHTFLGTKVLTERIVFNTLCVIYTIYFISFQARIQRVYPLSTHVQSWISRTFYLNYICLQPEKYEDKLNMIVKAK